MDIFGWIEVFFFKKKYYPQTRISFIDSMFVTEWALRSQVTGATTSDLSSSGFAASEAILAAADAAISVPGSHSSAAHSEATSISIT